MTKERDYELEMDSIRITVDGGSWGERQLVGDMVMHGLRAGGMGNVGYLNALDEKVPCEPRTERTLRDEIVAQYPGLIKREAIVHVLRDKDQPRQPLQLDENGVQRFRPNALVRFLVDSNNQGRPVDLNQLAVVPCTLADKRQFWQQLGYSHDGYCDLSFSECGTAVDRGYAQGTSDEEGEELAQAASDRVMSLEP